MERDDCPRVDALLHALIYAAVDSADDLEKNPELETISVDRLKLTKHRFERLLKAVGAVTYE